MPESPAISDFAPRVGERFSIGPVADGLTFDTELVEATVVGEAAGPGSRIPFSLVFRGPAGVVLPQRIYRVHHPDLGSLDIFLVPIGPDSTGMRYEAIFT
ncbi:MAG: hypothetical protein M3203_14455 [Actinomycetota bacterium]|nr:hypothetical protein [Actinomycetota bacterium]